MDLKLDPETWDLALEKGDFQTVDTVDAVVQKVLIRLRIYQGEWERDTRQGFPWFQEVLGKKFPDFSVVTARVVQAIRTIPEVQDVTVNGVEYDAPSRTLTLGQIEITAFNQRVTINEFIVL